MKNILFKKGDKIKKKSNKPFKCGNKIATIKDFIINLYSNKEAVIIEEDNTIVDIDKLTLNDF